MERSLVPIDGSEGPSAMKELLLGSVCAGVVREARGPATVVRWS